MKDSFAFANITGDWEGASCSTGLNWRCTAGGLAGWLVGWRARCTDGWADGAGGGAVRAPAQLMAVRATPASLAPPHLTGTLYYSAAGVGTFALVDPATGEWMGDVELNKAPTLVPSKTAGTIKDGRWAIDRVTGAGHGGQCMPCGRAGRRAEHPAGAVRGGRPVQPPRQPSDHTRVHLMASSPANLRPSGPAGSAPVVSYLQRTDSTGGAEPAPCDAPEGEWVLVPFTTVYTFLACGAEA